MEDAQLGQDYAGMRTLLQGLPALAESEGEPVAARRFGEAVAALSRRRAALPPDRDQAEMDAFRRACLPVVLQSELAHYVFSRPRGYPGDFVTQELIWNGRTLGGEHRYRGLSPAGRLLGALTLDSEACAANETRLRRLARLVRCGGLDSVASIGCGSAIEYWGEDGEVPARVLLLDQDEGALRRARDRGRFAGGQVSLRHENVVRTVLRNGRQRQLGEHDLVYSFGLLDYFPVPMARRLAAALWESVRPGGRLLLTNAHPGNPTRAWMEWAGDWWLDHKHEAEMRSLADGLPDAEAVGWELDPHGVYQHLEVRRAA